MDVGQVASRITPRTRAIMAVHIYGLPVDMGPLLALADRHGLAIIEDAAEMHGQTYRGRPCGSFGNISTFSFYPNKHVTTGEGGMLLTDDARVAERCRGLRNLCFQAGRRFVHEELGWNLRMTNLQAALGVAQLERLGPHVAIKRAMGRRYNALLAGITGIELPPASATFADSIYWVYGLVMADSAPSNAAAMMARLATMNVGTRPFFWPMHEQPVFLKRGWFAGEHYPVAERLARRGFYLPSGMALTAEQQQAVAEAVLICLSPD
jgi:perosamine synthetase